MNVATPPNTLGEFFIPATTSLQERRPRTLKHGETFAVFDQNGDILAGDGVPEGLYHRDTRYLSRIELIINGRRPILLSSTMRDDNAMLTCDLTNPDLEDASGYVIEHDLIHVRRSKFLYDAGCYERLSIRNYSDQEQELAIEIRFDADYADLFEVRGNRRSHRGERHRPIVENPGVTLAYTGLDQKRRTTSVRFYPKPARLEASRAFFHLKLGRGERAVIYLEIGCDRAGSAEQPISSFLVLMRKARQEMRRGASRAAAITTANHIFNEAMCRSISDLTMLVTDTGQGPYPYAGIPWYSTAFGRDALITALQTLWLDPAIAQGVLSYLADHQAQELNPAADAEPGKILHEVRHGEMAELGEVPFRCYYGSVDSTPLFIMLAGAYLERTGDLATVRRL
ncbi:MAG: amylo-alpha-1,6-glucosidase, partial [Acetobacteraceae bacterium]|nr:amylo-alpha-1,6-glucosidase [Acetobacteraceae bacterium]